MQQQGTVFTGDGLEVSSVEQNLLPTVVAEAAVPSKVEATPIDLPLPTLVEQLPTAPIAQQEPIAKQVPTAPFAQQESTAPITQHQHVAAPWEVTSESNNYVINVSTPKLPELSVI